MSLILTCPVMTGAREGNAPRLCIAPGGQYEELLTRQWSSLNCSPEQALVQLIAPRNQLPDGRQQVAQHRRAAAVRGAVRGPLLLRRWPLQRARQHLRANRQDVVGQSTTLRSQVFHADVMTLTTCQCES